MVLRRRVPGVRSDEQAITGAGQKLLLHQGPKNRGTRQGLQPKQSLGLRRG